MAHAHMHNCFSIEARYRPRAFLWVADDGLGFAIDGWPGVQMGCNSTRWALTEQPLSSGYRGEESARPDSCGPNRAIGYRPQEAERIFIRSAVNTLQLEVTR